MTYKCTSDQIFHAALEVKRALQHPSISTGERSNSYFATVRGTVTGTNDRISVEIGGSYIGGERENRRYDTNVKFNMQDSKKPIPEDLASKISKIVQKNLAAQHAESKTKKLEGALQ